MPSRPDSRSRGLKKDLLTLGRGSCAQTAMHPANVYKTLLQTKGHDELKRLTPRILTRGAGAQFLLSLPHGALAFAVLEVSSDHRPAALRGCVRKMTC
jgi:hypothetical protein